MVGGAVGTYFGGPVGGMAGSYVGGVAGDYVEGAITGKETSTNLGKSGSGTTGIGGAVGSIAGEAVGSYFGGSIGGEIGSYVGEQAGNSAEKKVMEESENSNEKVNVNGGTFKMVEGTKYIEPKPDDVEAVAMIKQISPVKELFKEMREKAMEALQEDREISECGADQYPKIWTNIDELAAPVYKDLEFFNELVEDTHHDHESPGKHCSVTHLKLCPNELKKKITALKCVIQQGVVDVMTNQALLSKNGGKNILDSMWNQLWEYGERGPIIELPSWCQNAIDSINVFQNTMIEAWNGVFDCWEREFITRLWSLEVEHHASNWERTQTREVMTIHNHIHPIVPLTMFTLASVGGDGTNMDMTPLKGVLTCPGHLEKLMKPVCVDYRVYNISHLAKNYVADIKSLCHWLVSAIEAVGLKLAVISAVMSDPTLSGKDENNEVLNQISKLREKNSKIREKVEEAYCTYQEVGDMKNKKEYDEQIALAELQPNKYSNEDQLNMTSSLQSETNQSGLGSKIDASDISIGELMPWSNMSLNEGGVEAKPIAQSPKPTNFDDIISSIEDEMAGRDGFNFYDEELMDEWANYDEGWEDSDVSQSSS